MNPFEPPITDPAYLFTRSNEGPTDTPEVEAKLAPDYDFHGFSKEGEDDEVNEGKDYDEDDELLYGDLKGTNETMGEPISTNQTTATEPKLVNATGHADNSQSTTVGNSANVVKTSESTGNLSPVSNDGHPNTTSNAQVLSSEQIPGSTSTSNNVDKNLGNVGTDISNKTDLSVHENFGETPGSKDSASNRLSKNIKQNKQTSDESSVPQSAENKFKNPEPPSSENSKALDGNNVDNRLSEDNTDNEQHAVPVFQNSEQSENSQSVKEANGDNENNQEQDSNLNKQSTEDDNPAPAGGDNSEPETNKQSDSENSNHDDNMTPGNVQEMANSENEKIQTKAPSKDSNSDTDTNYQNSAGAQNEKDESQNEKDESQMSQDTHEQNNVNLQEETSADSNSDDGNGNLNPDANRENPDNLPENTLSESTNEEQQEPTELPESQNDDANDQQTSSNSLQPSTNSPIAVTGKPEFITAKQEESQSENTQAWAGESTEENDGISQEGDQGKSIQAICFYHTRVLASPYSVRWKDPSQLRRGIFPIVLK